MSNVSIFFLLTSY